MSVGGRAQRSGSGGKQTFGRYVNVLVQSGSPRTSDSGTSVINSPSQLSTDQTSSDSQESSRISTPDKQLHEMSLAEVVVPRRRNLEDLNKLRAVATLRYHNVKRLSRSLDHLFPVSTLHASRSLNSHCFAVRLNVFFFVNPQGLTNLTVKRVQSISGPLQAGTQSLKASVYTRTIVFHHWLVHIVRLISHQHCDNPCVNWWLGGYGIADCKGHAMHCISTQNVSYPIYIGHMIKLYCSSSNRWWEGVFERGSGLVIIRG